MLLKELFSIHRGLLSSKLDISETRTDDYTLPYIRPASEYRSLIAGYLIADAIPSNYIHSVNTLLVSTDGHGSHTYAYVSGIKFVPNSNVVALKPKREMSTREKIFYAMCITKNRWLFSYGRKPKAGRLASIELPEKPPGWIFEVDIPDYEGVENEAGLRKIDLSQRKWKNFSYADLFDIQKGTRVVNSKLNKGETPLVRPLKHSNGYAAKVSLEPNHDANTISVNYNSQGGVAEAFYQPVPYFATDDVNVLYSKFDLTPEIGMFLITLIRKERFRFNYGRKWNMQRMKESIIKLPVDKNGDPDWDFMQSYIESLPYSSTLSEESDGQNE